MKPVFYILVIAVAVLNINAQHVETIIGDNKVTGTARDKQGLPIAGATFTVRKGEANRSFAADTDGNFELNLMPGDYEVTVSRTLDRKFKMFLKIPENEPAPTGLNIILDPAANCCAFDDGKQFPNPISLPKPPFPPAARAVRAGGEVVVEVSVNGDGKVMAAKALTGHPLLRAASVAAARQAAFEAEGIRNGTTVYLTYVYLVPPDNKTDLRIHTNPYRVDIVGVELHIDAL